MCRVVGVAVFLGVCRDGSGGRVEGGWPGQTMLGVVVSRSYNACGWEEMMGTGEGDDVRVEGLGARC